MCLAEGCAGICMTLTSVHCKNVIPASNPQHANTTQQLTDHEEDLQFCLDVPSCLGHADAHYHAHTATVPRFEAMEFQAGYRCHHTYWHVGARHTRVATQPFADRDQPLTWRLLDGLIG